MEEGRCGWYGIDDAICMERSAAARLLVVRYGIPFKRVFGCFSEHWNVFLVLQHASHDFESSLYICSWHCSTSSPAPAPQRLARYLTYNHPSASIKPRRSNSH